MEEPKPISVEEFDRMFDDGEDITPYLDLSSIRYPGLEMRRVNVDFPGWVVEALDREAARVGVPRQSIIKMWIVECLGRAEPNTVARAMAGPAGDSMRPKK
jgi:hypothetical protein